MTALLRGAGAVLLAGMLVLAAWSAHHQSGLPPRPGTHRDPDLVGLLERYDDDAFVAITVTEGMQRIAVTADTTVTAGAAPGSFADLRPGFLVAVWTRPGPADPPVAAAILAVPTPR